VLSEEAADALDYAFGPGPLRAFVYPGGQTWTVRVVQLDQMGAPILRFSSRGRSVDLTVWPDDWTILSYEDLVALLQSVPRTGPPPAADTPRRRWNDFPAPRP
jgi:hypothetical protein